MRAVVQVDLTDAYTLTSDSYSGAGGYADGSYLVKYKREQNVTEREEMASYTNYVRPVISARVDPVFAQNATRMHKNAYVGAFLEDADNKGNSLQEVIHKAVTRGTLLGQSFLIVDNFARGRMPRTKSNAIANRLFPYAYFKSVADVVEYETDRFGNLTSIIFDCGQGSGARVGEESYLYKEYSTTETRVFEKRKTYGFDVHYRTVEISKHEHGFGEVPIARFNTDEVTPFPEYYSLSTIARKLYNKDSELNDLGRAQNFSILVIPSISPNGAQQSGVIVSSSNALFTNSESKQTPHYISPDSKLMDSALKLQENVTNALIQSADVLGSSAVQRGSKGDSGTALSYKFYGKQQALKETARVSEKMEKQVIKFFGMFLNKSIDYSVKYDDKFSPSLDEANVRLETIATVQAMNISVETNRQLYRDTIALMSTVNNWDEGVTSNVLDDINGMSIELTEGISDEKELENSESSL